MEFIDFLIYENNFLNLIHLFEPYIWIITLNHLFESFIWVIYFIHLFESSHFLFLPRQKPRNSSILHFANRSGMFGGKIWKGVTDNTVDLTPCIVHMDVCAMYSPDPCLGWHSFNLNGAAWLFTIPPAYHRPHYLQYPLPIIGLTFYSTPCLS